MPPQNEPALEFGPAEPSKEGGGAWFAFQLHRFPRLLHCTGARAVAQLQGGIDAEEKGRASLMLAAEIRKVLGEGLQLLPLKSR